jgi:hypothetical protein
MKNEKIRVIKDFEKLEEEIQEQIKLVYPNGFSQNLITFTNKEGKLISALPFETDEKYYLIRMTNIQAKQIITEDEDYDDDGILKDDSKEEYEDKYSDLDYLSDDNQDDELD